MMDWKKKHLELNLRRGNPLCNLLSKDLLKLGSNLSPEVDNHDFTDLSNGQAILRMI